jgi:hypothetical protein
MIIEVLSCLCLRGFLCFWKRQLERTLAQFVEDKVIEKVPQETNYHVAEVLTQDEDKQTEVKLRGAPDVPEGAKENRNFI